MNVRDNKQRLNFARHDEDLRKAEPECLRNQAPLRPEFDHARDPLISQQIKDMEKTEAQRRDDAARTSNMVKKDRPKPELRPKERNPVDRDKFNNNWLKEQREAQFTQFERQRNTLQQENSYETERQLQCREFNR
jgi:hypothetical protein